MNILKLALLLLFCAQAAWAGAKTGAAFLKIGTSARAEAMGGAYTALADDVNALHYNPGGLAALKKSEVAFTHAQWLLDSKFDFVGFAQPSKLGTFGVSFLRLGTGSQEARDENRRAVGGFTAADSAYSLGYGRSLNGLSPKGTLSLGANVKYLESRIGSDSASTLALDLGGVHQFSGSPLSLGFSALNMGRGMKFMDQRDPLPLALSAGAAYRLGGALHLALSVSHEPADSRTGVGIGTEYAVIPMFMLRAGYGSQSAQASSGGSTPLGGFGGGFGLKFGNYSADYTFTPFGDLGNAQRISLGARF